MINPSEFQRVLLQWFDQHGRKNLPWHYEITPYKVWVSEIMLQQTQVATVIPYFNRFMVRFPNVESLAAAPLDEVLHYWSGLGYYARARNLHKAALEINQRGRFPSNMQELLQCPGIGRSTAGAILSIAFQQAQPILDGNVKRVLTRFRAIQGWPGATSVTKQLWEISTLYTPTNRCADYTQAIMDLGATVCKRTQPLCDSCPLRSDCLARRENVMHLIPATKPRKSMPIKQAVLLVWQNSEQEIFLQQRPENGIWGGLWSLPEFAQSSMALAWLGKQGAAIHTVHELDTRRHTFSHFHLDYIPLLVRASAEKNIVLEQDAGVWYKMQQQQGLGLPAPVTKLLTELLEVNYGKNGEVREAGRGSGRIG